MPSPLALQGKRILVTQADAFMGPVLCEVLAEQGATVIASVVSLADPGAAAQVKIGRAHV